VPDGRVALKDRVGIVTMRLIQQQSSHP
jgi:hypothetical protein